MASAGLQAGICWDHKVFDVDIIGSMCGLSRRRLSVLISRGGHGSTLVLGLPSLSTTRTLSIGLPPVAWRLREGHSAGWLGNGRRWRPITIGGYGALCWNEESARLARAHNDANMLTGRAHDRRSLHWIVDIWLETPSKEGGRCGASRRSMYRRHGMSRM